MTTSVIDKNCAHQLGSDAEEMSTVLPVQVFAIDESKKRFVDERGGLKSVACAFLTHVTMREAPQFLINERHQLVECGPVAVAPIDQQLG